MRDTFHTSISHYFLHEIGKRLGDAVFFFKKSDNPFFSDSTSVFLPFVWQ